MIDNNAKVAVIMSVYKLDDSTALIDAATSILNQSYACDLYLYRDGKVPLYLQNTINELCKNDKIKYFYSDKNAGLACALNKLIDAVLLGDYQFVARMDSDDISRCERIVKQVNYFNEHSDVDVCGTSCREFGASYALDEKHLPQTHDELMNFSIVRCPFIHPSVMFRSSVFITGNRYPINTSLTEDMALWFDLLKKGYKFANINEILIDYRLNEDTINRRMGFVKAFSEVSIRSHNMLKLKKFSLTNLLLIYARIIFHLMPSKLLKLAYKKAR